MNRRDFIKKSFGLILGFIITRKIKRKSSDNEYSIKKADFYKKHDLAG